MYHEILLEASEVTSVQTGDHGTVDYRGSLGAGVGNGHILTRLTIRANGVQVSIRGLPSEVRGLIRAIASLEDDAALGLTKGVVPPRPRVPDLVGSKEETNETNEANEGNET